MLDWLWSYTNFSSILSLVLSIGQVYLIQSLTKCKFSKLTRTITGLVCFTASDWLKTNTGMSINNTHLRGLPVVFTRVGLGNFYSKTFSKQHKCVHWPLGKLMGVVSFHWAWRTMRLWQKLGSAVTMFFFILSLKKTFVSLENLFLL